MLEEAEKHGITTWVEPFVGGANMIDKVPDSYKKIGYDLNEYLISMFNGLINGFIPNDFYSKSEYEDVKININNDKCLSGYIGFNCSYSGKWFGGFAGIVKTKNGFRNYQDEAKRNVLAQIKNLNGTSFICDSYENLNPVNCLIYCDPPYQGTTGYKTGTFDHEKFFDWCREQAKRNIVFVSEYNAPDDFIEVWSQEVKSSLSANGKSGSNKISVEKLFRVK